MPETATTSAVYAARPTFRLDDREETELSEGLQTLMVEETTGGLYRAEATFGNWGSVQGEPDYLYLDRRLLDFGKTLLINAGSRDTEGRLFEGRITGIEAIYPQTRTPEITILAEDRLQDLRMTRRTRTFEDETDSGVFESIAGEHGLQTEIDLDGGTHRVLAQVNQSDLAFLRDRATALDAEVWIEDATLHAVARPRLERGELELVYGRELREFSVLADLAQQRTALTVSGWDVAAKDGLEHEATDVTIRGELNGDVSGASVLRDALGERTERIVHEAPGNQDETRILAESRFRSAARRFVTGRGLAQGDARLRVGAVVRIGNIGPIFNGAYRVTEVRHQFDARGTTGFITRFAVERAGIATT